MRGTGWIPLFVALAVQVASCTGSENPTEESVGPRQLLTIGLIPEQNIFEQRHRYEPLARYLEQKVGARIELRTLPRYGNIVKSFQEGQMDGAFFGSFTYVLTHMRLGVEVLARPQEADGSASYHGLLLARKDGTIRNAEDMRGKVFVFVDKATTAGYLFPLAYFREHGISDYRSYFQETYFAGTHAGAVADILAKRADVGAVKNTVFERMEQEDPELREKLVILARCPDVPENGLAVRADLDAGMKRALKEALLNMDQDPDGAAVLGEFGALRFINTTDSDYEPVVAYAEKIGLDLAAYDYVNE